MQENYVSVQGSTSATLVIILIIVIVLRRRRMPAVVCQAVPGLIGVIATTVRLRRLVTRQTLQQLS
ncbi:hypothetical protein GCM10027176_31380 [Actinoallomurus bryophytorum]|uniref:Uncharacterized protein n=1 Tax=Actinoallomurus bryophytorum TaxID=1490222 RepID=A0A543CFX8_9ACTN|nr:hypothetical protein [Actinoallomurus bryophytorum]TQL96011.1 hypothetical protein FB559_1528 [Actinoallomurus bryophytorum]